MLVCVCVCVMCSSMVLLAAMHGVLSLDVCSDRGIGEKESG